MINRPHSASAAEHHSSPQIKPANALETLFAPRTVAVIGATETAGSVGRAVIENLGQFKGSVFPVNPKRATVLGKHAYSNIGKIPELIDLAVIVTPATSVPAVVRECVAAKVRSAIIISAGFKECGPAGAQLEKDVLAEARRNGLRFLGPNCLGLMVPSLGLNATFAASMAQPGRVAFISQSGALCTAVLDWSARENVGFSAMVSVGSMLDISWGDLITFLGNDPHTKSIVCYMESVGDAKGFLSAAREVALTKPIIILKVGQTQEAARAAVSHTGAMTGSDAVLDAAFRRVGVLRVSTIDELFNMAEVLAKQPRPKGPRLSIVTNAGGAGALATDMLVSTGGKIAELSPATLEALNQFLPPHWSHGNPIDVLGDADGARYGKAINAAIRDPQTDGLLVILTPQAMTQPLETAQEMVRQSIQVDKPVMASWMGGAMVEGGKRILNLANIPTYDCPDTAARAFAALWRYSDNLRALYETPALLADIGATEARQSAEKIFRDVRKKKRTLLTEVEAKKILTVYGIPTVPTFAAFTKEDAVKLAAEAGYPVVLKVLSETLTHKTDVGGVKLDLKGVQDVLRAWAEIQKSVSEKAGPENFTGVSVQPMIKREGYELILGSSIDPQFGPVLLFGLGGQLAEVFGDRALGLPPLNATLAQRMMEQTRIYRALKGVRGRQPVNWQALIAAVVRFSHLVAEQPWISEIDINPLIAGPGGVLALDARIVLHPPSTDEADLPKLAIRPYPTRYITHHKLKDGSTATIRPIRPEDEPQMVQFHHCLSHETVYLRYFGALQLDQRVAHERLSRMCFIDYDREMALVVERLSPETGQPEILGVGRLSKLNLDRTAEFALTVADGWQNQGIGAHLLRLLVQIGRDEKIECIRGTILPDNPRMQHVARKLGFKIRSQPGPNPYQADLML